VNFVAAFQPEVAVNVIANVAKRRGSPAEIFIVVDEIMKKSVQFDTKATAVVTTVAAIIFATVLLRPGSGQPANSSPPPQGPATNPPQTQEATVDLTPSQTNAIKIEAVATHLFTVERMAVGGIDYDEDLSVEVFPSYQGKILTAYGNLGDQVRKGQPLYTIESPDLIQADSTLIGAAALFDLTSKELARAKSLYGTNGVSEREMEQATSDEQTAEGALRAARDAVRVFGKSDAEIDQMLASRKIDPALVVPSPVSGRITARNAQTGLLVQPGNTPAPYSVADLATKWMVANVIESDSPLFHEGQPISATVMAYPDRVFDGKISRLGASVDPNTHRVMVRCEIADPKDELRPGMLATFTIQIENPIVSVAIPMNGVVRNGDGTMAAWVTADGHRFVQRIVKVGLQQDGQYQVLAGLQRGELAVTDGAVFISNILYAPPTD
jgi:cobalt-zinc-cadmium efflux system membrane fusion protein